MNTAINICIVLGAIAGPAALYCTVSLWLELRKIDKQINGK